ncbi:hypothetical protein AOLI_G00104010 [Acnodon oligacanthus]
MARNVSDLHPEPLCSEAQSVLLQKDAGNENPVVLCMLGREGGAPLLISVNSCVLNIVLGTKQKNKSNKTAQAGGVNLSHTDTESRPPLNAVGPYVRSFSSTFTSKTRLRLKPQRLNPDSDIRDSRLNSDSHFRDKTQLRLSPQRLKTQLGLEPQRLETQAGLSPQRLDSDYPLRDSAQTVTSGTQDSTRTLTSETQDSTWTLTSETQDSTQALTSETQDSTQALTSEIRGST